MHLILAMYDASIVTVFLCLKVNSCQIIKTIKYLIQHVQYMNKFPCRGDIVKYEELLQHTCFDS
mgnify:CR=1 FL=1